MIEVLRKIWRFAGEEQGNIRKSMVGAFVGRHPGAAKQHKTQGHGHRDHRRDPYHQFAGTGSAEGGIHQLIDPHIGDNNAQPSGR